MTNRASVRLAYALAAFALSFDALGAVLLALTRNVGATDTTPSAASDAIGAITVLPLIVIGTLVAARRARNPIGWVFIGLGVLTAVGLALERYAIYTVLVNRGWGPGGTVGASLQASAYVPYLAIILFLVLLFPSGRFASRRWQRLAVVGAAAMVGAFAVTCMDPGTLGNPFDAFANPLGVEALSRIGAPIGFVLLIPGLLILLASIVATILRFRASSGTEREQFKWFALSAALLAVALLAHSVADAVAPGAIDTIEILANLAVAGLPIAAGVAILRYRLYEIDRIINRTLVYGVLTGGLAGLYFAIVIGLQEAFSGFTRGNDLAIAGSTLAVAALFRPARSRIQTFVDRRFYRGRYDAEQTLAAFNARLRDHVDLDQLGHDLGKVVHDTMQPAHVSLWLRPATSAPAFAVTISGRSRDRKDVQ